ncbi:Insulinase (Peptidase M16) [Puccinia graminis f. sp. tritici]|uniref:Insulinase (Peptidase M16) n=1 Tax=Puccinia graminis f. sp. tritici TaxID=56615 RepID=A0A5B0PUK0_PUCGR|nr:Insulinase (Peptidase M16) [Puccinia graminis f. sp. tritici]KAA1104493.1 Insulinase (Peptidase M16) [Puccinia graminis f. sp. tritici]
MRKTTTIHRIIITRRILPLTLNRPTTTTTTIKRLPSSYRNFSNTLRMADPFTEIPAQDHLPAYSILDRPIIKSASDNRSYRIIKLQNHLQAILIHDPKTDKAAAAMDVNVGHLSDPQDLQGLAHFCEHLLFLGNQKYPSENEYSEYLSKNSGHSNAYTGMDNTVYYFDVHPSALDGALDRFSQFFISPTFTESCTEREIRAVDSENSKNLQNDAWRIFQLDKATSSPNHSFWRFGTGNLKTLVERPKALGLDIRQELLKFYSKHYSSNVMSLAVLAKEPLEDLTKLVVQKFSLVPSRSIIPDRFDGSPYTPKELSKLIITRMVKDTNYLEITFPMPDQAPYYDTQPLGFISHHIGHEGPGSVMSYLKKMGWVNTLSAGASGGVTGFDLFKITLDLTANGLENYKQVVQIIFAYLDLLKSTPPQEWAFKEQALLSETRFRFKSPSPPSSYVTSLATWLRRPCPKEKVISSVYLTDRFDAELIQKHLELVRPENCRILLGTQTALPGVTYDSKEQWYGTEYTIQPLPEGFLKPSLPVDALSLPPPNSFISTNFHVDKPDQPVLIPTRRPTCLRDDQFGRVWHKKDDRWWLPRASVILMLRNPITNSSCINSLKTYFISRLLKDALNEELYEAEIAGLGYEVGSIWDGLVFNVDGYNEKLGHLMETILRGLKEMKVDRQRFEILKKESERAWKNFILESPYSHAAYWMGSIVSEVHYSYEEKLDLLAELTPEEIEAFIPEVLGRGFVESLVHGNMTAEEALSISTLPQEIFGLGSVSAGELKPVRPKLIPQGSNIVYQRPLADPSNVNSAVDYMIAVGDMADDQTRVKLMLLAQMVQESCFNQLRTKEQLGYIVRSYTAMAPGQAGLKILIQSERDPVFVESRIEHFLDWFLNHKLLKMTPNEFEEMKTSLVNKIVEDFKNMSDETSHYWMHIKAGYYAFEQRFLDGALIKKISKESMVEFYRARVLPSSASRAKCSTQIVSLHVPVPSQVLNGFHSGGADQDKKEGVVDDDSQEEEEGEEEKVGEEEKKEMVDPELRFEPTPADLTFLHSKPDRASLLSYMETKKKEEEEANVDRLDRLIKHLNLSLDQLDQQVLATNRAVNLRPSPQIYSDIGALKDALDVGVGAVPVKTWKAQPALIDLAAPPASPIPKL